ncbi:hypothetical protein CCICO_01490 [Corynebacterium ciconiae DSM 44920]|uniref:DUF262 domain-containing protein n=1 Tax=Corynebacterium ciconiae TaxID=227319 RepID=UPI00036556B0|nr:DUF262 domain-containing protein [Corynebacterium ciconiae]WKD60352.1 hypothetical protein CCICO_01490 [Corynebacterium ciconiae DSM 44920]
MRGNVKEIYTIFSFIDRELKIPVYQRNYDWGVKQCERLFDDLEEVIAKDRPKHFFGAVVGKTEGSFSWIVIDGQQRLTTVSLLMLALSRSLETEVVRFEDKNLAAKIRRNYLELGESSFASETKLKLKPVKDDLAAYRRLLDEDLPPIERSNITANYEYFLQRIAESHLDGDQLWTAIQRLEAMILDLEHHDDPQRIFESLNSTGKKLKESDKIRNLVLMGLDSKNQDSLYEHFWNPMERNVSFDTDSFVRLYLVSKTRRIPRKDHIYDEFRRYLASYSAEGGVKSLLKELLDYSQFFKELNTATTGIHRADVRLSRYNIMGREIAMPFLMPLVGGMHSGEVTADDFADVIEIIDAYVLRRTVVGLQSNALNKIFATLYNEALLIRAEGTSFKDAVSYLLLRRADTSGQFPTDEWFGEEFATRNMYNLSQYYRRYVFECLENYSSQDNRDIAARLESGELSVEHIMPQTLSKTWRAELGPEAEEIHKTWLHRIGNLTVTGYNSSYSNESFARKKSVEGGFNESPYRLNHVLKQTDTWDVEHMKKRTDELVRLALEYWPMIQTDFEPVREPMPTTAMGDTENFTNRVIVSYEWDGQEHTVSSFREMTKGILRSLLAEHREAVYDFAGKENFGISHGAEPISPVQELVAPELWCALATSTQSKIILLRALFDHLKLDPNELIFTLRPGKTSRRQSAPANRFAALTKFIPRFEQRVGVEAGPTSEIRDLQAELFTAATPHLPDNWQEIVRGRSLQTLEDKEVTAGLSADEIFAALHALFNVDQIMGGGVFPSAVHSGSVLRWLQRLEKLGDQHP